MNIYKIPVRKKFKPVRQIISYPLGNVDYGVEQDFEAFLEKHPTLLTNNPEIADWHYLPIYWTRWHLNHEYGKKGLDELQNEFNSLVLDSKKTFSICQYADGPKIKTDKVLLFLSSRKTNFGFDIPLLRNSLKWKALGLHKKKYLASFVGRLDTHPVRLKMYKQYRSHNDEVLVSGKGLKLNEYVKVMKQSLISLSPRGHGGNSYRFYEAMELGVVPLLISDLDTRPFKTQIDWGSCSFYLKDVSMVDKIINKYDKKTLIKMGKKAKKIYEEDLRFGKWCSLLIKTLEKI